MQVFVVAVSVALVVSFMCSIFESVLLSLNHAQVEVLVQKGKPSGKIFKAFKERIDIPISAILITNTAAHTIGTAVAGATYADAFDAETLWVFTVVFTFVVLLFSPWRSCIFPRLFPRPWEWPTRDSWPSPSRSVFAHWLFCYDRW